MAVITAGNFRSLPGGLAVFPRVLGYVPTLLVAERRREFLMPEFVCCFFGINFGCVPYSVLCVNLLDSCVGKLKGLSWCCVKATV